MSKSFDHSEDLRQEAAAENRGSSSENLKNPATDAAVSGNQKVEVLASEYEAMKSRLQELEEMRPKLMLAAADFENAKKRLAKDKEEFLKFGQEKLLRELLPVLDNLERALLHSKEDESTLKQVVRGVEMVAKQFLDMLKKQGLSRIQALGEIFDPHRHEAVAYLQEEGKDHEIIDEIESGYMLHDRLLRVAKVRVRVAPQAPESSQDTSEQK